MDQQLESRIIGLAKQDITEFEILYKETVTDVFRYVYAICRNKELTEDVVSKTFLKAMKNIKSYDDQGKPFKAWLFVIARNLLYNEFSAGKSMQSIDDETEVLPDEKQGDQLLTFVNENNADKVRSLLLEQPKAIQEIFYLKLEEELSFEEIAVVQQSKVSAVKMRYYRTLEKMRVLLA